MRKGLGRAPAMAVVPQSVKLKVVAPMAMTRTMDGHTGLPEVPEDSDRDPDAPLVTTLCHIGCLRLPLERHDLHQWVASDEPSLHGGEAWIRLPLARGDVRRPRDQRGSDRLHGRDVVVGDRQEIPPTPRLLELHPN